MCLIALSVKVSSKGPILYMSDRVGKGNIIFEMPKFRTMNMDSPEIATHLMTRPEAFLSPIGGFLRRFSLDELPQLISILKGEMSFVGPRPALYNQFDLISMRSENDLDQLLPGLTGWAQVNGRDELPIADKVELDMEYMERMSFWFDMKILWMTIVKVLKSDGVVH